MRAYAHAPYNSKSGPFEWLGYSIEFLVASDGDEVSVKFFITHWVPIRNSADSKIRGNYDETCEVILFKIHSVQEKFSEYENLA